MIKPFMELTKKEFKSLAKQKMTYAELAEKYPQPKWCGYPEALEGVMGCWSLLDFRVTSEDYCKDCDCYREKLKEMKTWADFIALFEGLTTELEKLGMAMRRIIKSCENLSKTYESMCEYLEKTKTGKKT